MSTVFQDIQVCQELDKKIHTGEISRDDYVIVISKRNYNDNGFGDREAYIIKKAASKYPLKLPPGSTIV